MRGFLISILVENIDPSVCVFILKAWEKLSFMPWKTALEEDHHIEAGSLGCGCVGVGMRAVLT